VLVSHEPPAPDAPPRQSFPQLPQGAATKQKKALAEEILGFMLSEIKKAIINSLQGHFFVVSKDPQIRKDTAKNR